VHKHMVFLLLLGFRIKTHVWQPDIG